MKRFFSCVTIIICSTLFWSKGAIGREEGIFYDIAGEIYYGEECLRTWQIKEAARIAGKLLLIDPEDPYVQFFAGKVSFYEGNYDDALAFMDKARKSPETAQMAEEFYDFTNKIYLTAGKFTEVKTDHFLFRYVEEKDAVLVDYALSGLEKAYNEIGRDLGYFPEEPVIVEVYPDADSFCTISTLTKEEIETSGTVAICLFNRVIITSPRLQPRGYRWVDTLTHEYVHYVIMKKTYNRTPIWLHEGIAKFEETRWSEPLPATMPISMESLLAEAVEREYFITFDQMYPSLAKLEKREDTALAFAEVFSAVDYLFKRGGYPVLVSILNNIRDGEPAEQAIAATIGISFDEFQKDWLQDLKQKKLKRIPGLQILPTVLQETSTVVDDLESVAMIEVKAAKKYTILGDLLRRKGLSRAAIIEYEKAFKKAGYISPQIQNKLAMAYIMDTQYTKAEKILETALNYYPEYTTTYITFGELYTRQGTYEDAINILSRANYINPFNPLIHEKLAFLYEKTGRQQDAAAELKRLKLITR